MKLDIEEIVDKVDAVESERADYVELANRWQRIYMGQAFTAQTRRQLEKDGQEVVVTPDPYNVVNLALRLTATRPRVIVPSRESTAESNEKANIRERWLSAAWQQFRKQQGMNVLDNAAWQTYVLGRHVFEVKWVKDKLPKARRDRMFPILVRNLDPRAVGVRRGPLYTEFAYHKYEVQLWQVLQRWPDVRRKKVVTDIKGKTRRDENWRTKNVTITDFWYVDDSGAIWNAVLLDDEFLKTPAKTDYPDIPIIEGYGDTTMTDNEAMRSLSLMFPLDGTWQSKCRALSMQQTGMLWYFWPFIYVTNEMGQIVSDLRIRPGEMDQFPPGTNVNVVQIQPNMPLAQSVMGSLEQSLQQSGFPGVMYGEAPGDLQAGYGVNLLADAAKGRVRSYLSNLENSIEQVNSLMLGLVEEMATESDGVEIWGTNSKTNKPFKLCLYPEHMEDGYYENRVELKPNLPENDVQRITLYNQLVQAGVMSKRTMRDMIIQMEMPDDEQNQIYLERAQESQELMQKVYLAALQAYYPNGKWMDIIQGTPLEQLAQPPQPPTPPPGPPGMPGMPPEMGGMPPGMPPGGPPPGMGGPPPGMPPEMGGMPPQGPEMGGMPPGMPPEMGMFPPGPEGMQPPGMPMPGTGGGIPPELQGMITPEMLGLIRDQDPVLFQQIVNGGMPPEELAQYLMGMGR